MKTNRVGPIAAFALLIVGSLALARAPVGDPAQKLAEIREKRDTAMADWEKKLRAAKTQEEGRAIYDARPGAEFLAQFKAVALEAKGTETAAQAWVEVFDLASDTGVADEMKSAIDAIVADHAASPELVGFATTLGYAAQAIGPDKVIAAYDAIVAKSTHEKVLAPALLGLGTTLLEQEKPESKARGRKALERLIADFAAVKPKRGGPYSDRAKGFLFELDHLQIGMVAPNFESVDENGQKFSIADYKGKVVVLDFWGIW